MTSPHGIASVAYRPPVMGTRGMVASGHPLASMAGIKILQEGGGAVDAAVAVGAALNVVEPHNSGMGGDGFIMIYDSASGSIRVVNATGAAPYGAKRELYQQSGIPLKGILSVSVPGILDGWLLAHAEYGKLDLERVFDPAVELAGEGFPVSAKLAEAIAAHDPPFVSIPSSGVVFTREGRPLKAGEILVQKDLAASFRTIAKEGRDAFYKGSLAKTIVKFSDSLDGLLTEKDLADHKSQIYDSASGSIRVVNATGAAPYGAKRELYQQSGIPLKGILSVSVPGILDGWLLAHAEYGKLDLERVFDPAVELAGEGFPVSAKLAEAIAAHDPPFVSIPSSGVVFTREGRPLKAGEILVQKDLAASFRTIAKEGRDAFYKGSLAKTIV